ncbi:hypothetical protein EB796_017156 [Bugula neritina]|uniref:Uncharacterized protein n=1 Tax=Bugula neritina TaxID=10212 RepID=A0A7J7JFX7_BUGNE|nr:hypothetical protein EB796_017156 [Bugula neritina]
MSEMGSTSIPAMKWSVFRRSAGNISANQSYGLTHIYAMQIETILHNHCNLQSVPCLYHTDYAKYEYFSLDHRYF